MPLPFLARAATALALVGAAGSAAAFDATLSAQRTVYVSMGREARLTYFASPDPHCGAGPKPEITIVEKPSYGKISIRTDRILARPAALPARSAACVGKFFDMAAVFYKPTAHFRGSDRVVLRVTFAAWPGASATTRKEEIYLSIR